MSLLYTHCIYTLQIFISSPMGHWNSFLAIWRRALRACWIALYHGEGPYKTLKGLMARWKALWHSKGHGERAYGIVKGPTARSRALRHNERPYGTVEDTTARWRALRHNEGPDGMVKGPTARRRRSHGLWRTLRQPAKTTSLTWQPIGHPMFNVQSSKCI